MDIGKIILIDNERAIKELVFLCLRSEPKFHAPFS